MSKKVSADYGIPLFETIDQALCLGGQELAVDAVLCIGEHGNYPYNELGQHMYPRKEFFDQVVAVMKRSNRFRPAVQRQASLLPLGLGQRDVRHNPRVGNSVHGRQLGTTRGASSTNRILTRSRIVEAVSIHGGGVESYDFHALEVPQSMVEARKGGETGVSRVQFLDTEALWKAAEEGLWSPELARAAMQKELGTKVDDLRAFEQAHGVLLNYKDGLRAIALKLGNSSTRWNFACKLKNEPEIMATALNVGPWQNRNLFKALSHAIQSHFIEGEAPYPVERTLLVSGILDAEMHSRHAGGKPKDTPQLEFAYAEKDFRLLRESGASWKLITEDVAEPAGINPNGDATIPEN